MPEPLAKLIDTLSAKNLIRKNAVPLDTDFSKVTGVLIAFDFAGGAGAQYDALAPLLTPRCSPVTVKHSGTTVVLPYVLPGRSGRFSESMFKRNVEVVDEVMQEIVRPLLKIESPVPLHLVFLGYSAGASVAAELAHRAMVVYGPKSEEMRRVRGIVLVAESGPSHFRATKDPSPATWSMEKMSRMVEETGIFEIADELKVDKDFYNSILERLAGDMALEHEYGVPWETRPSLPSHMSMAVFAGSEDTNVSKAGMRAWADIASGSVRITWYKAGHHLESEPKFFPDVAEAVQRFISSKPADDPDESEYEYYSTTDDEK
jgi:surfactin synthase thioesterase subunit